MQKRYNGDYHTIIPNATILTNKMYYSFIIISLKRRNCKLNKAVLSRLNWKRVLQLRLPAVSCKRQLAGLHALSARRPLIRRTVNTITVNVIRTTPATSKTILVLFRTDGTK